jgi:hypothetical protein
MTSVTLAFARLVRLVVGVVVLIIVAAIVLRLLSANQGNTIVSDIHSAGRTLAGPFKTVFSIKSPKTALAVNWGLAALVYLLVGGLIVRLFARLSTPGIRSAEPVA